MQYYTEYEICALFFLILITIRFFEMRRFPNHQNKVFGTMLFFSIADLSLDIISSYIIEYINFVPVRVAYFINTLFYSIQLIMPIIMLVYVLVIATQYHKYKKTLIFFSIPLMIIELLLITNVFHGFIFHIDEINGFFAYKRGALFSLMYIISIFYIVLIIHITLKYKKLIQKKQSDAILCFILIVIAAVFIQYMYPAYLVTGVAIALAILMIFFTMQNPEDMLDLISGMFNYNAMMSFLRTYLTEKHDLWLVAIDVGGIRRINSAFGVEMGNQLLAKIGAFFNGFSGNVWAFRMIGTKFLITTSNEQEYNDIIIRVEERFNGPWRLNGVDISLSATIRYFGEPNFFNTPEEIINIIDLAYSQIETDGWGTKKCINTRLLHQANRRLMIENAIRESLCSGKGFVLNYQPIFSIEKNKFLSAEVLLRLEHPDLGSISPSEFIPIAEKTGLILQIDELVIRKACDFLKSNNSRNQLGIKYLEINLSAAEFFQNSASDIHSIIRKSGISPSLLCFEVTETAATVHKEILSDFMEDMINLGYSFALDDFGTGYANISQVLNLQFSIVKLDRMLLISDEEKNMLIFDTMLDMFSKMGLTTIVEGVETFSQAERVYRLGGKHIQGYFYAHPMPEREFVRFLKEKNQSVI